MSSISIRTGLGRNKSQNKRSQKQVEELQATQTFPVLGIMVMIIVLAILSVLLFSQPQTLSLSGIITSRSALDEATVQCSSKGMTISGTSPMAYNLNYAMGSTAVSNNLSADGTNTLTLSINSAITGIAPNIFTAYDGVVYAQNGRNYVNAFLTNDAGQPLYINATVACN